MGWGDELLAAGEAQRLYEEAGVKVAITHRSGQVRWHDLWRDNPAIATPREAETDPVQRLINGPNARPYHDATVPFTRRSGVRFTAWRARDHRGRIYLSESELSLGRRLRADLGPYWFIEPSPTVQSNPNKRWSFTRFQQLVSDPRETWVQPLHHDSTVLMGAFSTATPTFRDACGLLASAEGFVGTEGGLHHAAAALRVPAVVIFGGCMSVETFGYPEHVNLADDGPESPCGRWLPCAHCARAMERITVAQVLDAIRSLSPATAGAQ